MNNWTSKDFRKAAFAVGFGLAMGKIVAKSMDSLLETICKIGILWSADNGFEPAQKFCNSRGIEYGTKQKDDEPKMKIGFH